jgi:hypothetical protein
LAAGCASTTPPPPTRFIVHVDRLAPEKVPGFEAARLRFASLLRDRGVSDKTGLYLKVGDSTYYSLVSFGAWRDLDVMRAAQRQAQKKVGQAALEAYWRDSDVALVFPHAGEIWSEQRSLSYVPTGRRLPDAVQVVIEDVAPAAEEGYEAAWKEIIVALTQARYPVERRSYFSTVGTGRMLTFWLAPSVAVMKAAPTLQQALTGVLGPEKADALLERWRKSVQSAQTFDVEAKPEMSAY